MSVIEAEVVVATVAITLAVGGVLLDVVGNKVPEREAIVGRYEVDGAKWRAFAHHVL